MDPRARKISHLMSSLLRHRARAAGLVMDAAGWVALEDLIRVLGVAREIVEAVVDGNDKERFQIDGARVRAAQGHSLEGTPVTREALEASWAPFDGDAPVWHGTSVEAVASIARQGILAGERTHVHLAEAVDSRVGKRANVDVLLEISTARLRADGLALWRSPNGVILCRHVPAACITGVQASTKRARAQIDTLRAAFALDRGP